MLQSVFFSEIETIDKNEKLYLQKNFYSRARAFDFMEFHLIDRIKLFMENPEAAGQLHDLKLYAEKVGRRLIETNDSMFHQIRSKIAGEGMRGEYLMNLFEEYLEGHLPVYDPHNAVGYDELDLFLNGILTTQILPAETLKREPEMVYYQKTPARIILDLVKRAEFKPQDVFVDLGSGLGQVVNLVHLLTGVKSMGVEFEPAFCEYAGSCAADLNMNSVEFINIDARDADYSAGTVFFMYSPFEGKMLQKVLERLSAESKRRGIKLFTYGPCTVEVAKQDWLINRNEIQNGAGAFGQFLSA